MKAGAEVHFLAGQIFMMGIAAVAIAPRVPSDSNMFPSLSIGGRLSFPFRRALIWLIAIGIVRTLACHLHHPDSSVLAAIDGVLGTVQVVGQSFLCMTTAYILQCQMETVINIDGGSPGVSLRPTLVVVLLLTVAGAVLSRFVHPNWFCLENLAEAISCLPVLKTLKTYASVTTVGGQHHGRGPVLVQVLLVVEYWFMTTAILSFGAEALNTLHGDLEGARPVQLILEAIRTNQDNGVDDWTRLLLHSIFLNTMDELQHFTGGGGFPTGAAPSSSDNDNASDASDDIEKRSLVSLKRRR